MSLKRVSLSQVKIVALILLIVLPKYAFSQSVVINEFLASNSSIIADGDNDFPDWIELYNSGNDTVYLNGCTITDDPDDIAKWIFPAVSLLPCDFLLVWASGKNRLNSEELHTNFKLKASGEFIGFYDPAGSPIDTLTYGSQTTDISYGRKPDGSAAFLFFKAPSPNTSNNHAEALVPSPIFSLEQNLYEGPLTLELSASEPGLNIYYTTNGKVPTKWSKHYSEPLSITSTTILRALCINSQNQSSLTVTKTYFIDVNVHLPVLSLIMDPYDLWDDNNGIYVNYQKRGDSWERPVSATLFTNENGLEFTSDAGIRIHGYNSRSLDKKSFRLYFRGEYGKSILPYQVFDSKDIDEFKRLIIRSGGQDQITSSGSDWTLFRNPMLHTLLENVQPTISAKRSMILYLNGQIWGLYNFRERIDKYYLKYNFGIEDADLLKVLTPTHHAEIVEGDEVHWLETYNFFNDNNLADSAKMEHARQLIDVDNYTDLNIFNIYGANFSWPQDNIYKYRERVPGGKWRWVLWDVDHIFALYDLNKASWDGMAWATRDRVRTDLFVHDSENQLWSTLMLRKLLNNQEYKHHFINRFADMLNTTLNRVAVIQVIDSLAAIIEPDINLEIERWDGASIHEWRENAAAMKVYADERQSYCYRNIMAKFGISDTLNITINIQPVNAGLVQINSITLEKFPWTGTYFRSIPVTLIARANPGYRFVAWNGVVPDSSDIINVALEQDTAIQLIFEKIVYPPVISEMQIDSISARSAIVSWRTDKLSNSQLEFGLDQSYGTTTDVDSQLTFTHSIKLNGLLADTTYHVRAKSKDADGNVGLSDNRTFTTLDSSFLSLNITEIFVEQITPTGATISWQTERPATSQALFGMDENLENSTEPDTQQVIQHSVELINLVPKTTYYFKVKSGDRFQNQAVSELNSFATRDTTTLRIQHISVDSISFTCAKIIWETNKPSTSVVNYGLNRDNLELTKPDSHKVVRHEILLTELIPNTTYYFKVSSEDEYQNQTESGLNSFTTRDTTTLRIQHISVDSINFNCAKILWETNKPSTSVVTYGLNRDNLELTKPDSNNVIQHEILLTELIPDLTYYFRVHSNDMDGAERAGDTLCFSTRDSSLTKNLDFVFQVEVMPYRTTGHYVPPGWNFGENGSVGQFFEFRQQGRHKFTLRAQGQPAQGVWPEFQLSLDDSGMGEKTVNVAEYDTFSVAAHVDSGWHKIVIAFTNYFSDSLEARSLIGDWLRVEYIQAPSGMEDEGWSTGNAHEFALLQNYPNPANSGTQIKYHNPKPGKITLKVFNLFGQEVKTLVNSFRAAGSYSVAWDGCDDQGKPVASGVYLYRLEADGLIQNKKCVILK